MKIIADLQIHSKYARAVSPLMILEELDRWADDKGIQVMGTGDFTHPAWFGEIKQKLEPAEPGLFRLKPAYKLKTMKGGLGNTRFMLTSEISNIYTRGGRGRRVHNLIWAPDIASVEKLNTRLSWVGNLLSDGRPILGLDSEELLKICLEVNVDIALIPAHCLLPDTIIHTQNNLLKPIKDMEVGDMVLTHNNRWRRVKELIKHNHTGKIYHIQPRYFSLGLTTTGEHPFFAIKTHKNCHWSNGICKPSHKNLFACTQKHFKSYKPEWISAEKLEQGDVLVYPRFVGVFENHKTFDVKEIIRMPVESDERSGYIIPIGARVTPIKQKIFIDRDFCRLAGYYVAEGYMNSRDLIGFSFNVKERAYIDEVIELMKRVFGFDKKVKIKKEINGGIEILFYSKILCQTFKNLFYYSPTVQNASTKALPHWMLGLTSELQVEIFRCWWRGDAGYTVSRLLLNQVKIILLRLGIIPSIQVDTLEQQQEREKRKGFKFIGDRRIKARYNQYAIQCLSFFEDTFNLLETPEFSKFKFKTNTQYGWIDEKYIYIPIFAIKKSDYEGDVYNLEIEEDNSYVTEFTTVHNCWTPWFSVFGSMSGFDTLQECYGDHTKYIFAIETGLSSDPVMNWRLSQLDTVAIVSNSDSHSLEKIGREANVFDCALSYAGIMDAIKSSILGKAPAAATEQAMAGKQGANRFLHTIEFFPEEGKYHYDGHRVCGVSFSPTETKQHNGICPSCGKGLTIGVANRMDALADRPLDYHDAKRVPYTSIIPLHEVIADALNVGKTSKRIAATYAELIKAFGSEFSILLDVPIFDIRRGGWPEIAEAIDRVRQGKVHIAPGYDGEFGHVTIFSDEDRKNLKPQTALF